LLGSTAAPIIPIVTTVKAGGAIINDNGFTIGIGEILLHDPTLGTTNDGGLLKFGPGTLTLTRTNTYTGPTVVSNGTLAVSGVLAAASAVTVDPGATLSVSGIVGGNVVTNNGTVAGTGIISGSILNSGNIAPGGTNTVGTLTVTGVITNLSGSATTILLLRGSSPSNSVLAVPGTLTYGGNLVVTNLGTALAQGDTFKIFSATNYTGSFASITLPALSSGLAWQTSSLSNGVISVIAGSVTPTPVISSVMQSLGNLVFSGTNGAPNGTFYVLSSTNLALPISKWTLVSTNTYTASGSFAVTNPIVANGQPGFFVLSSTP
jgi:autotransporter-associated beta strand protein